MKEKDQKKPMTPRRHRVLDIIDNELSGKQVERPVEVLGKTYVLRTLDPAAEAWADNHVDGANFYQTSRNRRAPYVAAALVGVVDASSPSKDLIPVEAWFTPPEDMTELERKLYDEDPAYKRDWVRERVFEWVTNPSKSGTFVQELHDRYLELWSEREEALAELDPLRRKTPSGASSDTSSLAKDSVLETPTSSG